MVIHSPEIAIKRHPDYRAAKSGDVQAAFSLVGTTIAESAVVKIRDLVSGRQVILASAHAVERDGVNAIPEALADELGARLNLPVDEGLVQINIVGHTGANGFARLARPAVFDGEVIRGAAYWLVDDFVGQGGTLANLKGHIENRMAVSSPAQRYSQVNPSQPFWRQQKSRSLL